MRITAVLYVLFVWAITSHVPARADDAPAQLDLTTQAGIDAVQGAWRYKDAELVPTQFGGKATWDYTPHAGARDFDDTGWERIDPTTLAARRGHGRISFNWYRLLITVPEQVNAAATAGTTAYFETSLDDYAEVWVDGELPRLTGQNGGSVVAGWNATNRLVIGRNVKPGQKIQLAVFGINGPISDPPTNFIWMRLAKLSFEKGPQVPLAVPVQEVNVRVVRLDPALDAIVPANPKIFKLAEGFQFTEGPVWSRDSGYLLFSDPNANRIYAYEPKGGTLSLFRPNSGYEGADIAEYGQPGSNGLTFDPKGRLTIDQHGNHRVVRVEDDGQLTVLADRYDGKRLNSPNDLVYRSDGAVYFTDPPFGLPKFYDDPRKELPYSGVYRSSGGKVTLLTRELQGPNGIAFSPDERFLYIGNWDPAKKVVLRFPVKRDGALGASSVFADLTREVPGEEALDGIKVDKLGNLYLSAPDGLRIYSSAGKHLGTVIAPRPIHNFAWGGEDGRTLYLTARDRLYRIALLVEGVRP
ncbi:MAG TPA: SMP-30/gluconolactonase/LRE family protein [Steroidobacteraceae bacterium]|nr:SMP-30/gluconolactonase/LRE family protein [Steroidobacteraceae bacterium]